MYLNGEGGGVGGREGAFSGKPLSSAQPPGRPEKVSDKSRNSIEKSTQVSDIRPNKLLLRVCRKVTSLDSESSAH